MKNVPDTPAATAPTMEESETILERSREIKKSEIIIAKMRQSIAKRQAALVKIPLPPLNLKYTGKLCPKIMKSIEK